MAQLTCSEISKFYSDFIKIAGEYRALFDAAKSVAFKDNKAKSAVWDMKNSLEKIIADYRENMDMGMVSFGHKEVFRFEARALKRIMEEVNEDLRQFKEKHGYSFPLYTEETFASRFEENPWTHFVEEIGLNDQSITRIPKSLALLTHINKLYLQYTGIEKIEYLENFPDLVVLDLSCCQNITDPTPLLALPKLESLGLSNTGIDHQKYRKEISALNKIQGEALLFD
jgi:hypothetical protein